MKVTGLDKRWWPVARMSRLILPCFDLVLTVVLRCRGGVAVWRSVCRYSAVQHDIAGLVSKLTGRVSLEDDAFVNTTHPTPPTNTSSPLSLCRRLHSHDPSTQHARLTTTCRPHSCRRTRRCGICGNLDLKLDLGLSFFDLTF